MTQTVKSRKVYFKMLDKSDKALFPMRMGQVVTFKPINIHDVKEIFEEWQPKDVFPMEVAWQGNDPTTRILIHYDGWGKE